MILEILFYLTAYILDLFSALTLREFKPNVFRKVEANSHFVMVVDKFGIIKGILVYTLAYTFQMAIIFFLAVAGTYRYVFGSFAWKEILVFAVLFMAFMHVLGMLTNIFTLIFRKEVKPEAKEPK